MPERKIGCASPSLYEPEVRREAPAPDGPACVEVKPEELRRMGLRLPQRRALGPGGLQQFTWERPDEPTSPERTDVPRITLDLKPLMRVLDELKARGLEAVSIRFVPKKPN